MFIPHADEVHGTPLTIGVEIETYLRCGRQGLLRNGLATALLTMLKRAFTTQFQRVIPLLKPFEVGLQIQQDLGGFATIGFGYLFQIALKLLCLDEVSVAHKTKIFHFGIFVKRFPIEKKIDEGGSPRCGGCGRRRSGECPKMLYDKEKNTPTMWESFCCHREFCACVGGG